VFPLGSGEPGPDDALGSSVAETLLRNDRAREVLTAGIFVPPAAEAGLGGLEAALAAVKPALEIEARLRALVREGKLAEPADGSLARAALETGLITERDFECISAAEDARDRAIQVDAFDPDEFRALRR
jgi:acyl-CoA dehydrogenase